MIIWRGMGILVPVIGFGALLITQFLADAALGTGYYSAHPKVQFAALFVAAAAVWFLGSSANAGSGRVVYDSRTGQNVKQPVDHTFFFVPMQYWAVALLLLGLLMLS